MPHRHGLILQSGSEQSDSAAHCWQAFVRPWPCAATLSSQRRTPTRGAATLHACRELAMQHAEPELHLPTRPADRWQRAAPSASPASHLS